MPTSPRKSAGRSNASRRTSARGPFRRTSTPTRSRTRNSLRSSARRKRDHEGKADQREAEDDEPERDERTEDAPPLHHRDPVDEEPERPGCERGRADVEGHTTRARVLPSGAKHVSSVQHEPDRPDEDEAEDERRRREGEQMARPAVAPPAPRSAQAHVERCAPDPVRRHAVDRSEEEDEDGDDEQALVHERLVEEPPGGPGEEDSGDPREKDERQDRLLPRVCLLVGVVAERGEDRSRRLQDRERPQPPEAFRARLRPRRRLSAHPGRAY